MPKYEDGDVIGIVVDMKNRDLIFYKNGRYVMYWEGVIQGPCRPYFLSQFTDSSATLIQWNGHNSPLGKQIVNRNFKDIENRNVVNENKINIDAPTIFWMVKNKDDGFVFIDNTTAFASIFKKKAVCEKFCTEEGDMPQAVKLKIKAVKG